RPVRGALPEDPWLRAHERASGRIAGVQGVRRGAGRTHNGLCVERRVLADEPWRCGERGGHAAALTRGGGGGGRANRVSGSPAFRSVPLVPWSGASLGEADEPDGARRVPGAARFVVPERAVLTRPAGL